MSLSGTSSFWSGVDAWHFPKEWQEWTPETNTSNHVEQVSFRQCITFREHRQLKGWQPRFQTTVAKSSVYDYDSDHALHTSRELQARLRKILNLRLKPNVLEIHDRHFVRSSKQQLLAVELKLYMGHFPWTTCSKAGSSAWNSKKERQEWMSHTNMSNKSPFGSASHFANICR